jgi:hypothetical protein
MNNLFFIQFCTDKIFKSMKISIYILFIILSSGLAAQKVSSVYDGDYDFNGPKTYNWSKSTKKQMEKFVNIPFASTEIIKHFKKYGYELKERGLTDLIVNIDIKQSKGIDVEERNPVPPRPIPLNRRYRTVPNTRKVPGSVTPTHEGTFILKLIDPKSKHAVWIATGTDEIDEDMKLEKRQKRIEKMVKKMFKKFPADKVDA